MAISAKEVINPFYLGVHAGAADGGDVPEVLEPEPAILLAPRGVVVQGPRGQSQRYINKTGIIYKGAAELSQQ